MDEDKKYVRVAAKLFVEQTDKVGGGIAIVQSQRAAQPSYSGPLSGFRGDLAGHSAFERGNALLATPLFCQSERLVQG
jgi:hypothetical protein